MSGIQNSKKPFENDVESFRMHVEVQIDPPVDLSSVAKNNSYLKVKFSKVDDMEIDPQTFDLKLVEKKVVTVSSDYDATGHIYDYSILRDEFGKIVTSAIANGSQVHGQITVMDTDNNRVWRLVALPNGYEAQEAILGWPDGSSTPNPFNA